jgi:hypothetical protein
MLDQFIPFLENCIDKIKDDSLSQEQRLLISEFYTKFLYPNQEESETDLLKYLSMGWYIYNELSLLKIPTTEQIPR